MNKVSFSYKEGFESAKQLSKWAKRIMLFGCAMMLLLKLLAEEALVKENYDYVVGVYVAIVFLANLFEIIAYRFSFKSRLKKVDSLTDDAYDLKVLEEETKGYFDNENIVAGFKKAGLNVYESCYFSMNIAHDMLKCVICKILFWLAVIAVTILFFNLHVAVAILSITYPISILVKYIKFWYGIHVLENIADDFRKVFTSVKKNFTSKLKANLLSAIIRYEVAMTALGIELSQKSYERMNEKLTEEWKHIVEKINA